MTQPIDEDDLNAIWGWKDSLTAPPRRGNLLFSIATQRGDQKMNEHSEAMRKQVIEKVIEKEADRECTRCDDPKFALSFTNSSLPVIEGADGLHTKTGTFQTELIICANCGYVSEHVAKY